MSIDYPKRFGKYALVVGASTTVGEQFARQLAQKGMDVVLVARRAERLEAIAAEIRDDSGVDTRVVPLDLLDDDAIDRLDDATKDVDLGLLVINANLHKVNHFHKMSLDTKLKMLRMNTEIPVRLTDRFGARMVTKGRGGIIYVNALNALTALEIDAVFQGTKAFLLLFAESLWAEYRKNGVKVAVTMVNGIQGSESYENKLSAKSRLVAKVIGGSMAPERIVAQSLAQFERDTFMLIPDFPVPINRTAAQALLMVRMAGSNALTMGASKLFEMFLSGDEVKAGLGGQ